MSGIAGVLHTDGRPAEAELVARMARALTHRGPDGEACWISGPVGLAHRHLASASAEDKPPLVDPDGRVAVVDGRLDRTLERLARRGPAFVDDALGEFAVAAWDAPLRTLVCARDAFGVKPLYVHDNGRRLLVASEPDALFQDASIPRRPDVATIADYLMLEFRDPGATFFEGIRRVPPGHVLTVGPQGLSVRRYWTPDGVSRPGSTADHARELATRFHAAVSDRLADAAMAGVLLSGGIDSTLVAAVAGAVRGHDRSVNAFTYLHDGFLAEDWDAISELAAAGAIAPPRTRRGLPLADMLLTSPEPPSHEGFPVLQPLLEPVATAEFRVLLTGIGGDELSSAAERGALADRLRAGSFVRAWREAAAIAHAYGGAGRGATADVLWSALSPRLRRTARGFAGRDAPAWLLPHVACARRPAHAGDVRFETRTAATIWRALTAPTLAFALEKMDAEASRLEIEPRHPYLDRRVVECVLAIPPDVLVRDGYRKQFVQRSLGSGLLLRTVEGRAEHVASPDPAVALRHEAVLIERELFRPGALVFEYVDRACAERMRDEYLAGRGPHGARLWSFLLLDKWLRRTFAS